MAETATNSKNKEPEALVQRLLAAVDDVKVYPDGGVPMDIAFAEIREKLYKDKLIRRVKDAKEHPEETIPIEQAFAELRREFGVAEWGAMPRIISRL